MTSVRISVQAPEGDITVDVERDTITVRQMVGDERVEPGVLDVLEVAVARVRGAYRATQRPEVSRG